MLISKNHLDLYKPEFLARIEHRLSYVLQSKSVREQKGISVFLSHKHDESEILDKVFALLIEMGVVVYLDWQDGEMPNNTTGETAKRIKEKIIENKKFILLATNSAIESKWCNWELGFGDAKKYSKDIAIMPITENDGSWVGKEYLQIYPVITTKSSNGKGDYIVEFNNAQIKLEEWLKP